MIQYAGTLRAVLLVILNRPTSGSPPPYCSPRESVGVCFYRRWFVCLSVCDHDKFVDGFVPNFMGRFRGEREVRVSLRSVEGCGSNGKKTP